jgi:hypothetical protein
VCLVLLPFCKFPRLLYFDINCNRKSENVKVGLDSSGVIFVPNSMKICRLTILEGIRHIDTKMYGIVLISVICVHSYTENEMDSFHRTMLVSLQYNNCLI